MPAERPEPTALRGGPATDCRLTLTAPALTAAGGHGPPEPVSGRRFSFNAYTGAVMRPLYWSDDVVVDLAGVEVASQTLPALLDHWPAADRVLGQTDRITVGPGGITAEGDLMAVGADAVEAVRLADLGYRFQASIGASVRSRVYLEAGATATVNGTTHTGPLVIVRQSVLKEISATVIGADTATAFRVEPAVAPDNPVSPAEEPSAEAAAARGPDHLVTLAASGGRPPEPAAVATPTDTPAVAAAPTAPAPADDLAAVRARHAAEYARIARVEQLTAGANLAELRAQAVGEGWDATRTELEVLRLTRQPVQAAAASPLGRPGDRVTPQTLTAALCLRAGVRPAVLEPEYGRDVLDAALSREVRAAASLSYLLNACLHAAGQGVFFGGAANEHIRAAFQADRQLQAAGSGPSTFSLTGILSNVANKALLNSYQAVDATALRAFGEADANDFKQVERYRLTAGGTFERVGADGEIKHGTLDESKYTNKVETYARMLAVTRQDIINDDLGAFTRMGQLLGRNAALTLHRLAFGKLLGAGTFFSSANKNLLTGAGSALSIAAMTAAVQKLEEQVDAASQPIAVMGRYILTPPALKTPALQIARDTDVNETTDANKPRPAKNPHAGRYEPLSSPFLGAQGGVTGGSDTKWWLLADPADVAVVEVVYLRGNRTPTIESSELDFERLGVAFRGFFDVGANTQDHRGAVQNNGA